MSSETAESFFGWLDYDERDAQRMREVFAAFDDKDTIDSAARGRQQADMAAATGMSLASDRRQEQGQMATRCRAIS